jgi:hypothetical protein
MGKAALPGGAREANLDCLDDAGRSFEVKNLALIKS